MFKTSLTRDVVGKLIIRNTFCYADPEIDEFFTLHNYPLSGDRRVKNNFPVLKVSMAWGYSKVLSQDRLSFYRSTDVRAYAENSTIPNSFNQ